MRPEQLQCRMLTKQQRPRLVRAAFLAASLRASSGRSAAFRVHISQIHVLFFQTASMFSEVTAGDLLEQRADSLPL